MNVIEVLFTEPYNVERKKGRFLKLSEMEIVVVEQDRWIQNVGPEGRLVRRNMKKKSFKYFRIRSVFFFFFINLGPIAEFLRQKLLQNKITMFI